jgi:glyoxylase-like metal-dependent hydrolase (beta-lactamase superfamily II)
MDCYSIEGNRQWLDGGAMFGNAPKVLWAKWAQCDESNRVPLACRALLVKTEKHTILFETGIGHFLEPKLAERYGVEGNGHLLLQNLKKIGFLEEDIDYIILSHLHFDHAGGLVPVWPAIKNPDWRLHFPNAKYVVSKTQFERSLLPHLRDRASYIPGLSEKLRNSTKLILVEDSQTEIDELKGLVSFIFTNGHTPGLMHSFIYEKNHTVFFASDLIPGTVWIHLPIVMGYDRFPELTVNEKKVVLEKAVSKKWIMFYTHDAKFVASRIGLDEKGNFMAQDFLETIYEIDL